MINTIYIFRTALGTLAVVLLLAVSAGVATNISSYQNISSPGEYVLNASILNSSIRVSGGFFPQIEWVERRYKIEAVRFKARDETGIDWLGSDEVMVETIDAKGWTVSDEPGRHSRIDDIDSGETYNFDPLKSCIVPVRPGYVVLGKTSVCDDVGEPAPLGFQVVLWETDYPPLPFPRFCPSMVAPGPGGHGSLQCFDSGNDFIGSARIDMLTQDLQVLPEVGDEYIETVKLDPCPGWVCAGYPDYTFTYRTTRLPDVRVDLRSVLAEAMQRSGIRSELEAIAAGLRSLQAPSPRKIEPENQSAP